MARPPRLQKRRLRRSPQSDCPQPRPCRRTAGLAPRSCRHCSCGCEVATSWIEHRREFGIFVDAPPHLVYAAVLTFLDQFVPNAPLLDVLWHIRVPLAGPVASGPTDVSGDHPDDSRSTPP